MIHSPPESETTHLHHGGALKFGNLSTFRASVLTSRCEVLHDYCCSLLEIDITPVGTPEDMSRLNLDLTPSRTLWKLQLHENKLHTNN